MAKDSMVFPDGFLQGKTALVTGGGTGIGRAISLALARAGADVVVVDDGQRLRHQNWGGGP